MFKISFGVVFLAFLAGTAIGAEKRIVFGAESVANGLTYEVGFCARAEDSEGDGPGHAFVVLQQFDRDGQRIEFLTAGFGPPTSAPVHPDGVISEEKYSHESQECLIAVTNEAKYEAIKRGIRNEMEYSFAGETFQLTRPYTVVLDDCVTFFQSVAKDFGLNVPGRIHGLMPLAYVNELKKAN
ncbi:hypothetical protein [Marinobacter segnicrescens]|uniref:hypothetical protein n=1 Tax=Marinobacter segnicrescens TaxID=430453 RepID=UPI003A8D3838